MSEELWNIYKSLMQTHRNWHGVLLEIERMILTECMKEMQPKNRHDMARILGLQRTTLYMKMSKAGIPMPKET